MEGSFTVDPRHLRRAAALIAVVVGSMFLAVPAFAQIGDASNDRDTQVVINGRLDVPQGQTDASAVLFNGTANIAGSLTGAEARTTDAPEQRRWSSFANDRLACLEFRVPRSASGTTSRPSLRRSR